MSSDFAAKDVELQGAAELADGRDWWVKQQKPGTLDWRAKENIDGILSTDAHQHYDLASQALVRVRNTPLALPEPRLFEGIMLSLGGP